MALWRGSLTRTTATSTDAQCGVPTTQAVQRRVPTVPVGSAAPLSISARWKRVSPAALAKSIIGAPEPPGRTDHSYSILPSPEQPDNSTVASSLRDCDLRIRTVAGASIISVGMGSADRATATATGSETDPRKSVTLTSKEKTVPGLPSRSRSSARSVTRERPWPDAASRAGCTSSQLSVSSGAARYEKNNAPTPVDLLASRVSCVPAHELIRAGACTTATGRSHCSTVSGVARTSHGETGSTSSDWPTLQ
mmetsp:Transcript_1440/g.4609  ORF Transcript_1440/g.4609 Transcript_1440/m.4609 type:complete len:251 (+) Transcript_1440:207-959(+)